MKLLSIILCVLSLGSAVAQTVTVVDPLTVQIDGVVVGKPFDTVANNKALAPTMQRALETWWKSHLEVVATDREECEAAALQERKTALGQQAAAFDAQVKKIKAAADEAVARSIKEMEATKQAADEMIRSAAAAQKEAEADKADAETKLRGLLAAVALGNAEVLQAEVENAKRSRIESRKRELEQLRQQLDRAESELQTPAP